MWRSLPDPPSHISWFGRLWVLLKNLKNGKFIASYFFIVTTFPLKERMKHVEERERERINSIQVRSWWKVRRVELVQRREVSYQVTSNDYREGDSTGRRFIPALLLTSHPLLPISCFLSFDTFLLRSFLSKGEIGSPLHFLPSFLVFGYSLARQCNPSACEPEKGPKHSFSLTTSRPSLNVCCSVTHLTFLSRGNIVQLSSWTVLSFESLAVNSNFIMYIVIIVTFWWLESLLQAWCQHVSFNCCVNLFHLCNNCLVFKQW